MCRYKVKHKCIKQDSYSGFLDGEVYSIEPAKGLENCAVLVRGKLVVEINGKTTITEGVVIPNDVISEYFKVNVNR